MIVLVGFMGAGKTTVGGALAARLGLPFLDSDQVIESARGRRVQEIFAREGEAAFRALERSTIAGLLGGPDAVLALGGGAVEEASTRELLAGTAVVFLQLDLAEALARTGSDPRRPLLHRGDLPEVFARRQSAYREVATITVAAHGRSVEEIVDAILARFAALSRSPGGAG